MPRIPKVALVLATLGMITFTVTNGLHSPTSALPLRLGIVNAASYSIVFAALNEGDFSNNGIAITTREYETGKDALRGALDGEVDLAMVYETPVVLASLDGHHVGIVSALARLEDDTALLSMKKSGIRSFEDLRHKRVGLTLGTSAEFFLYLGLRGAGISFTDVKIVDIDPSEFVTALERSDLDAIVIWEPQLSETLNRFGNRISRYDSDLYTAIPMIAGRRERILEVTEAVTRFVRGLADSEARLRSKPHVAFKEIREQFKKSTGKKFPWNAGDFEIGLNNQLVTVMNQEARWLMRTRGFQGPFPDFNELLMPQFLDEVFPQSVTVLDSR